MNIYYLLIIFRERGRKSATAPGGVALIDVRFGVAFLRSTPVSQLRIYADARAFYLLIKELFNSEALGICLLAKLQTFLVYDTLRLPIRQEFLTKSTK